MLCTCAALTVNLPCVCQVIGSRHLLDQAVLLVSQFTHLLQSNECLTNLFAH